MIVLDGVKVVRVSSYFGFEGRTFPRPILGPLGRTQPLAAEGGMMEVLLPIRGKKKISPPPMRPEGVSGLATFISHERNFFSQCKMLT